MHYPNKQEFIRLAKRGNLIPVYKQIDADLETPLSAFKKIDDGRNSYLLESAEEEARLGRYSFLGSNPSVIIESKGKRLTIKEKGRMPRIKKAVSDPLAEIEKFMGGFRFVAVKGLPRFCGGLVGYIGYDIIRSIEKIPDSCRDDLKMPDVKLILTDTILIFDHVKHTIKIVSNAHVRGSSKEAASRAYKKAINDIDGIIKKLSVPAKGPMPELKDEAGPVRFKSNVRKGDFKKSVCRAKEYIRQGDIIQAVLSQRFVTDFTSDPFSIYRALHAINPSPYMFYLSFGGTKLVGSSPEIMVRCEDGVAQIRPIAGTRPRGKTRLKDKQLEKELLGDPKERAEHLMLVDLGRNDLGRACSAGSIKVSEFMAIERYSHVMHIVSNCRGRLSPKKNVYDLLKASFPAGTVAGAPKIRAMEIIDELEKTKRGPYAGCVGYLSFSGNLDTCITIRTILVKDKLAYVQAGAGIVADSKPENEYHETVNKAKGMLKAIAIAKGSDS
ncbi:MAG: anthranilate synthase component I [Candidatus Omnitrophica bacterium]|nr:anthranilate synthase component I [Candidatus Omnitrophota bacterium]